MTHSPEEIRRIFANAQRNVGNYRKPEKRVQFIFAWYDLWVGFFYDRKKKHLYFFPLPMFGVKIILIKSK